jgi:hypothetical protein
VRTALRLLVAVAVALALVGLPTAPPANAKCDMASWTFPLCKIGKPSIPRFNMGGPRPPLTPKNDVWCTAGGVINVGGGYGWYPINRVKHDIRMWPDYITITYAGVYWDGRMWRQPRQQVTTTADCDA